MIRIPWAVLALGLGAQASQAAGQPAPYSPSPTGLYVTGTRLVDPRYLRSSGTYRELDGTLYDEGYLPSVRRWTRLRATVRQVIGEQLVCVDERNQEFVLDNYPAAKKYKPGGNIDLYAAGRENTVIPDGKGGGRPAFHFDYGKVIIPPRTNTVTDAGAKAAEDAKLLAWQEEQAKQGSASAQLEMGKRYLTGRGVAKNEALARIWFKSSADQGNHEAAAALEKLGPVPK